MVRLDSWASEPAPREVWVLVGDSDWASDQCLTVSQNVSLSE